MNASTKPPDHSLASERLAHHRLQYARVAQMMATPAVRHKMIAEAAYDRAAKRGFQPGRELEDWLLAEVDIDTRLASSSPFAW